MFVIVEYEEKDEKNINFNNLNINDIEKYNEMCKQYSTSNWIQLHPQFKTLVRYKISSQDLKELIYLSQIRCTSGRDLKNSDLEDFSKEFLDFLSNNLHDSFIRFSDKSLKDSFCVKHNPISTIFDFFNACTSSKRLLHSFEINPNQELFIFDWINIKPKKEYRVFVIENKIRGISQQHCYHSYSNDENELAYDALLILEYFKSIKNELPYETTTLDLFISNFKVNLIECNPPSYNGPSGSALFTQQEFKDWFLTPFDDKIYVKYR